ncbi:MAG: C69 family dipeptidase [Propionibacteriaceae bacterium]
MSRVKGLRAEGSKAEVQRPWSCDTFVALPNSTGDGSMLLAKNSDRPAGECQPLRYWPRRQSSVASSVRLAYLKIPDVAQSWAHLGGSPYWCWGHELGLNEWGVGIGNEALFTRDLADHVSQSQHGQPPQAGILGMELVRLGLERATTAQEAVSTITALVAAYGQWGSGVPGRSIEQGAYDNSYLVADSREAWVIETSGYRWAARQISTGTYAISNQPTIRTEWDRASKDLIDHAVEAGWWPASDNRPFDFARAYTDPGTPLQVSHVRLQRSRHLLAEAAHLGKITFDQAARILRDHYEDTFLGGPYFTAALPDLMTLCMHDSPAGFTWGNTASSTIMVMPNASDQLPYLWWAATTPCTSVYLPIFPAAASVPKALALPAATVEVERPEDVAIASYDTQSYWWQFQKLLDHVKGDERAWMFNDRQPKVRQAFDPLQRRWVEELPDIQREAVKFLQAGNAEGRRLLSEFTERCAGQALETCANLIAEFDAGKRTVSLLR